MRRVGSHITAAERCRIRELNAAGHHDHEIAADLMCSLGAVFRARHRMGLSANRAQDRADTKARRTAAILAALKAQGLRPGEATRVAYAIRSLRLGLAGHPLGDARVLRALESLEGGPATAEEIIDAASRDTTRRAMTWRIVQHAAVRLRRLGLLSSRRTKAPGTGRGGTPAEYWLTPAAVLEARRRDARSLRARPICTVGTGNMSPLW